MVFKQCRLCGYAWDSRDAVLRDENIEIVGYQVNFAELTLGRLLFNHSCRGTLSVAAEVFRDIYDGPVFSERATGGEQCPGHCLHQQNLEPCPAQCECAYIREIVNIIEKRRQIQRSAHAPCTLGCR